MWHFFFRWHWYQWQFAMASLTPAANLPPISLTPNLPLVSTTQAEMVAKFAIDVVDIGGKFAADVVDTGGNFATGVILPSVSFCHRCRGTGGVPWLANISVNFQKNSKWLIKKPEAKNLVTLSLLGAQVWYFDLLDSDDTMKSPWGGGGGAVGGGFNLKFLKIG